jgi:hypothetical protein
VTQESTRPEASSAPPHIVSGDQLVRTRLGPAPAPPSIFDDSRGVARLEGCLLAVVAEGSKALATDIALEGEESQLVLEVAGTRSAGWPWSEVISINADGIATDPEGALTQLLEISTADHTFRFLAAAYKVGAWVSVLPAAGRDCWRQLKVEDPTDDTIPEGAVLENDDVVKGNGARELAGALMSDSDAPGVDKNGAEPAPRSVFETESVIEATPAEATSAEATSAEATSAGATSEIETASVNGRLGGNRRMVQESEGPRHDADGVGTEPWATPGPGAASQATPSPEEPSLRTPGPDWLPTPSTPASPPSPAEAFGATPPAEAPQAPVEPGAAFAPGAPAATGAPIPPPGGSASVGAATGRSASETVAGPVNGPPSDETIIRAKRHAKRRLFGRSARSNNRLFSAHPRPVHQRPIHAQPLSTAEIVRNLFTWRTRRAGAAATIANAGATTETTSTTTETTSAVAAATTKTTATTTATGVHARKSGKHAKTGPPARQYSLNRRYATLGLVVLVAGTMAAGSAAAFQPGGKTPVHHVVGPVAPDWPQTHGLINALAPTPKLKFNLVRAQNKPKPASAALLSAPSLQSHEIFAFAPYWTLPSESSFNVADMTTLSYFGLDVNANGTINESGDGWTGYESQDLSDLITRAHAAGDRVVLTAECFNQATLGAVTSNPAAATTLGNELVSLVRAKNLDGVNIDFEGAGSSDQQGLDRMMARLSSIVRAADSHWQITMDTYASSAGDPGGFYDIAGLAPSVDAFFVMAYQMGGPTGSANSQFSGSNFSAGEALDEYSQVVPTSKVILGLPFYGYDWPTTGPSSSASATGPATPVPDSQIETKTNVYWNQASGTAWIAFKSGKQWHQTWFEDPTSLSLKAQLATNAGARGVGIWALGMEGNDPSMLAALVGNGPVIKDYAPSPAGQSVTTGSSTTTSMTRVSTTTSTTEKATTSTTATTAPSSTTTTTEPSTTTTTTDPSTTTTSEPPTTTTSTTDPESTTTTTP